MLVALIEDARLLEGRLWQAFSLFVARRKKSRGGQPFFLTRKDVYYFRGFI